MADNRQRALAIYHENIKPQLGDADNGRYIAIDAETGVWAISDGYDAVKLLKKKTEAEYPFILVHPRVWVNRMPGIRTLGAIDGKMPRAKFEESLD